VTTRFATSFPDDRIARSRRRNWLILFALLVVFVFPSVGGAGQTKGQKPPTSQALPAISGSAVVGQTLTASTGSWSGGVSSYAYQWLRCDGSGNNCSSLAGAASASYAPVSGDVGYALRVSVTASNKGGSSVATSNPTSAVAPAPLMTAPANTALPTISGSAVVGQTLTASTGTWSGTPTSYAYQWRRCDSAGASCANVSGATAASYAVASGDVGFTLRVAVTATNAGGSTSAASNQTALVAAAPVGTAPANTALPTISGSAVVGQTLTASTGTWSWAPTSYTYQWRRCDSAGANCANVGGATNSYALQSADAGSTMRVVVTATNTAGSTSATSAQTGVVATGTPTTSGYPASFYTGPAGTNIILPPNGSYPAKGAWIGEASGNGLTQTSSRELYFGRKFNIVSLYAQNRCDPWPASLAADVAAGYIPMVSWFPTPAYADQIIAGQADSCIRSFGNAIANQSGRVLVRPYWEFNGGWQTFSKNSDGTRATAAQEKQMWQHTIDVLRTTGFFSKASVVWSVSEGYYNNGDAWNNPTPYPGDSYVDWVASSGYNWNKSTAWCGFHAGWCTFAEALTHGRYAPAYTPMGVEYNFRGKKPYLVGETGSQEDPYTAGRKGQWMIAMGNYIKTYMPGLYALVYFDQAFSGAAWNLDSSTSSMDGFKSFANDPYFNIPTK
jgi:hypothetical protein